MAEGDLLLAVEAHHYDDPVVSEMVQAYLREVDMVLGDFAPERAEPPSSHDFDPPFGTFLVVYHAGLSVACGGVRTLSPSGSDAPGAIGEIRRMWVRPLWRRRGIGRYLLSAIEDRGRGLGMTRLRLDTANKLQAALHLYRSAGYDDIDRYNENEAADHWLQKPL